MPLSVSARRSSSSWRPAARDALVQVLGGDAAGRRRHLVDGASAFRAMTAPPAAASPTPSGIRMTSVSQVAARARPERSGRARAHLDDPDDAAALGDRQRQHAHPLAVVRDRLEGPDAAARIGLGLGGERQRGCARLGRPRARPAIGVEELDEPLVRFRPEKDCAERLGSESSASSDRVS